MARYERTTADDPCDICDEIAGVYDGADDPALWYEHPNCQCSVDELPNESDAAPHSGEVSDSTRAAVRGWARWLRDDLGGKSRNAKGPATALVLGAGIAAVLAAWRRSQHPDAADDGEDEEGDMSEFPAYALFDAPRRENGMVVRRCKVFELGNYPERNFSLNADEARQACAQFAPVPNKCEHFPTIFDGKLGQLRTLELGDDGKSLFGDVALPEWTEPVLADVPVKLSAGWRRGDKQLDHLALVVDGYIPDAALFSAYANFVGKRNNAQDQKDLQQIHDLSSGLGAECKGMPFFAATTKSEGDAGNFPARCYAFVPDPTKPSEWKLRLYAAPGDAKPDPGMVGAAAAALGPGYRGQKVDLPSDARGAVIAKVRAAWREANPDKDPSEMPEVLRSGGKANFAAGGRRMRLKDILNRWHAAGTPSPDDFEVEFEGGQGGGTSNFGAGQQSDDPRLAAMAAELARNKAQLATFAAERIKSDAAAFYAGQRAAHRVLTSAEAEKAVVAAFTQAATDDADHGIVTFAGGSQGSRVDLIKALFAAVPDTPMTQEYVAGFTALAAEGSGADVALTDEEKAQLKRYVEQRNGAIRS